LGFFSTSTELETVRSRDCAGGPSSKKLIKNRKKMGVGNMAHLRGGL